MGLRPDDLDTQEYVAARYRTYGEQKAEEYLGRSIHHVLIYPYLSVQSPLQQLRVLRPIAPDKMSDLPEASLQQRVEEFLFHQSELLDEKQWAAYIDLFAAQRVGDDFKISLQRVDLPGPETVSVLRRVYPTRVRP